MTPEQKQRAMQMLRRFSQTTPMTRTADNAAVAMAALLQDLVDAPEPEPVARVTGVYGGHTTVAPIDAAQVLRVGMALYTAPPALELTGARRASGLNEMLGKEPA